MKQQTIKHVLILAILAVIFSVLLSIVIRKYFGTMMLLKLIPFIQESEGGLSRDPKDKAASYPAPWEHDGKTGWHTNKGITYQTFKGNAPRIGYEPSKTNFFEMPDDLWLKILKGAYMSAFPLDKISHLPRIQAVIITWAWGSGVSGAERYLANFQREVMGVKDSNITPDEIVENFRKQITPLNESKWFQKLCDRRSQDFKQMATYSTHGRGWESRLTKFRKLFS